MLNLYALFAFFVVGATSGRPLFIYCSDKIKTHKKDCRTAFSHVRQSFYVLCVSYVPYRIRAYFLGTR